MPIIVTVKVVGTVVSKLESRGQRGVIIIVDRRCLSKKRHSGLRKVKLRLISTYDRISVPSSKAVLKFPFGWKTTHTLLQANATQKEEKTNNFKMTMMKPRSPIVECKHSLNTGERDGAASQQKCERNSKRGPITSKAVSAGITKRVTFNPAVKVKEIPHSNYLSQANFDLIWLNLKDYVEIRARCQTTLKMMMSGQEIDQEDDTFCSRGLKCKTRDGARQRLQNKHRVKKAVFLEQAAQREEGLYHAQSIADVATAKAHKSVQEAIEIACFDAKEAHDYLNNDIYNDV
jgi:hypothetical protein